MYVCTRCHLVLVSPLCLCNSPVIGHFDMIFLASFSCLWKRLFATCDDLDEALDMVHSVRHAVGIETLVGVFPPLPYHDSHKFGTIPASRFCNLSAFKSPRQFILAV